MDYCHCQTTASSVTWQLTLYHCHNCHTPIGVAGWQRSAMTASAANQPGPRYGDRGAKGTNVTTKAEQETVIRWDQEERVLHLYTAYPREARKWERLGYAVEVFGRTQTGEPRGWRARAPLEALRLRRLIHDSIARRRRGRSFGPGRRKLAASEPPSLEARLLGGVGGSALQGRKLAGRIASRQRRGDQP
jgi:hypothetical protein